jgi:hypothetical protein
MAKVKAIISGNSPSTGPSSVETLLSSSLETLSPLRRAALTQASAQSRWLPGSRQADQKNRQQRIVVQIKHDAAPLGAGNA